MGNNTIGATPQAPLKVSEVPDAARAWRDYVDSAAGVRLADVIRNPLLAALDTLAVAFTAVVKAQTDAAALEMRTDMDRGFRLRQQQQMMATAYAAATPTVQALRAAIGKARDALERDALPKAPASADGAMLALQAEQTIKYIESVASAGAGAVAERAAGLFVDALRAGDAASAYVMASPPVLMAYRRLGVNLSALYQRFGQALAEANGRDLSDAPGGIGLLPLLSGGPFLGFADACGAALYHDQQSAMQRYAQLTRTYPTVR